MAIHEPGGALGQILQFVSAGFVVLRRVLYEEQRAYGDVPGEMCARGGEEIGCGEVFGVLDQLWGVCGVSDG